MRASVAWLVVAACQATVPATPGPPGPSMPARDASSGATLAALYGKAPASLGTLFAGVTLGMGVAPEPEPVRRAIDDYSKTHELRVAFAFDASGLGAITVALKVGCDALGRELATAWGAAPNVWLDPATHQRARFDPHACTLRFDRYADVATWIDLNATAIVPLALIGTPASELRERLGKRLEREEPEGTQPKDPKLRVNPNALFGQLVWQEVGVGAGDEPASPRTVLTALTSKGTIVGLVVSASVDHATGAAIRDRITALVKVEPIADDGDGMMMWKSTPVVRLDFEGKRVAERTPSDRFLLEAGAQLASYAH